MNGIGLNGRCRLNFSGVRGEMNECKGSGPRPLDGVSSLICEIGECLAGKKFGLTVG
jgi:hypothetical protein